LWIVTERRVIQMSPAHPGSNKATAGAPKQPAFARTMEAMNFPYPRGRAS
jgi:hypothetical protein